MHLPLIEFAINDSRNASIKTTPFALNMRKEPRKPGNLGLEGKNPAAADVGRF